MQLSRTETEIEALPAEDVLVWAYEEFGEQLCLSCSWQKQSSVLVHMVSELGLDADIVELDTHLFFKETYETRERLVERYGLSLIQPGVITEAREGGTAGIFRSTGDMRTGLIDEIVHELDLSDIVFEAPTTRSQAWFIQKYGPDVNLGNIPPQEVIPLETLRLGLRSDTLKELLLSEHAALTD